MKKLLLLSSIFFPLFVLAAPTDLTGVSLLFLKLFSVFVPVIIGLALLLFLWGIAQYFISADNEQKRTDGKNLMIWGIIALFVMISVWGLVQILLATFGINPAVPFFPPPGSSPTP